MAIRPACEVPVDYTADDSEFLLQMVRQLDTSIQELQQREKQLRDAMDGDRIEELEEFHGQIMSPEDEHSCRRSLDWRERELLWIWRRLARARSARANAGQAMMRFGVITNEKLP
ncbi:MAG: hypothetical protein FIA97_06600 [Methylococcaceae bacterium]|nr:hypothetical protein [Methylococcaceae bacterium]